MDFFRFTRSLFLRFLIVLLGATAISLLPTTAQNRVISYLEIGSATPVRRVHYGVASELEYAFSPRVSVVGGLRFANQYPSGFGNLKAGATLFFPRKSCLWRIESAFCYANYAPYPMGELFFRVLGVWQVKHFSISFGNAFAGFVGSGVAKANLFRPSFCFRGVVREEEAPWNLAFFIRNFNRFESHGSKAVEWGSAFSVGVAKRWSLFCEPFVTTVGNFNGTANFYNFNCHIGGNYRW